jgi:hypothetical protein
MAVCRRVVDKAVELGDNIGGRDAVRLASPS